MKDNKRGFYGLLITIIVFALAILTGYFINILLGSVANSLATFFTMTSLACLAIYIYRDKMDFSIILPQKKTISRPIRFTILISLGVNIALAIMTVIVGGEVEPHPVVNDLTPWQAVFFVVIGAPISEELLFRGFLLNFLKPFTTASFLIFKRRISSAILISAFVFSLAHLVLISAGVGVAFTFRILVFTFILGLIAGYYQEKYKNTAYAILVHMSANSLIILALLSKLH